MKPETVDIAIADLFEALRYLNLPAPERLKLAKKAVGNATSPPAFLDDYVFAVLRQYGLIELVPTTEEELRKGPSGTPIATGPEGLSIVQLTTKGRDALAKGAIELPVDDVVEIISKGPVN